MKGFLKSQAPCWLHAHRVLIRQIDKLPKFDLLYFFTQKKIYIYICKVTICSPNPNELGYKPNEPNSINL